MPQRRLYLYVDRLQWGGLRLDLEARGLVLGWAAATEVPDIIYIRLLTLGLRWPPVRRVSCYINVQDPDLSTGSRQA